MKEIKMQKLSDEKFRKYGIYQDLLDNDGMASRTFPSGGFYADLIFMDFGKETLPTISVCHIKKAEKILWIFWNIIKAHVKGFFRWMMM